MTDEERVEAEIREAAERLVSARQPAAMTQVKALEDALRAERAKGMMFVVDTLVEEGWFAPNQFRMVAIRAAAARLRGE